MKKRETAVVVPDAARHNQPESLRFPADLLIPPKSQVVAYEDLVSERVRALDGYAEKLARGFGIPMTDFNLTPPDLKAFADLQPHWAVTLGLMHSMSLPHEYVTIEKRDGRWGLYFLRTPPLFDRTTPRPPAVPLKDAPLDVRERFLSKSRQFFEKYLGQCRTRLTSMKIAVASADETIDVLANLTLE